MWNDLDMLQDVYVFLERSQVMGREEATRYVGCMHALETRIKSLSHVSGEAVDDEVEAMFTFQPASKSGMNEALQALLDEEGGSAA